MIGITGYGAYVPRLRLARREIVAANAWHNPALSALGKGERAIANWDEDAVTMAVAAARDLLGEVGEDAASRAHVRHLALASTTLPFADRQNAGIVAAALNLDPAITSIDVTSSQRAGTTALAAALDAAGARGDATALVVAADMRIARPGSPLELAFGAGAAALALGRDGVIAEYLAGHTVTDDFVDHYRAAGRTFDYVWEERWVRQEGHLKLIPAAVAGALAKAGIGPDAVDRLIVPVMARGVPQGVARATGIAAGALADTLFDACGECGTAHPLVMLAAALEGAAPGETLVVCGFGQGADALVFRTTEALADYGGPGGVAAALARRTAQPNYFKYLAWHGLLEIERGMRAEQDKQTALTALYRNKDLLLGFVGGRCARCGTAQIPKSNICVNPNCRAHHTQQDLPFADRRAAVMTWTADRLAFSWDPPAHYGMVQFEGGGRLMCDFTDIDEGAVDVGMPVRMVFRIKDIDEARGFRRYFWKAAPAA